MIAWLVHKHARFSCLVIDVDAKIHEFLPGPAVTDVPRAALCGVKDRGMHVLPYGSMRVTPCFSVRDTNRVGSRQGTNDRQRGTCRGEDAECRDRKFLERGLYHLTRIR